MRAQEAMELSSLGIARRYDERGYAWLAKGNDAFQRVSEANELMARVEQKDVERYDDWEPAEDVERYDDRKPVVDPMVQ